MRSFDDILAQAMKLAPKTLAIAGQPDEALIDEADNEPA